MPEEGVELWEGLDVLSYNFVCTVTMRFFSSYKNKIHLAQVMLYTVKRLPFQHLALCKISL